MTESVPANRQELQTRIIDKALQDEAFKRELLSNPTATVMKELGIDYIPGGPKFQVLEETPDILYLVLPMTQEQIAAVAQDPEQLSDEELQRLKQTSPAYAALMKN